MTEAGGNPNEAGQGGLTAEDLASAMAGIADMFDHLVDTTATVAVNEDVMSGYRAFKERHLQGFIDVQEHGLQLANNIQAGAGEIAQNDLESTDQLRDPWTSHREINSDSE